LFLEGEKSGGKNLTGQLWEWQR